MKRIAFMMTALAGMLFLGTTAHAGGRYHHGAYGYPRGGYGVTVVSPYAGRIYTSPYTGFSVYQGFNNVAYGANRGYGYGVPAWQPPGHYDYHPAGIVPHGNHFHRLPGHYDYHR